MAVTIINGERFAGVEFSSVSDVSSNGYFLGETSKSSLLRVDQGQRSAKLAGVKYWEHKAFEPSGGERGPDHYVRVVMLVSGGPWRQRVWNNLTGESVEVRLNAPGDFMAWKPGMSHQWWPEGAATMVTVSFISEAFATTLP